jgi:hypothetical protein
MPLHMADIPLYRTRLFGLTKDRLAGYPWESPQNDLSEAVPNRKAWLLAAEGRAFRINYFEMSALERFGVLRMTRRSDIVKIFTIAAALAIVFYYLAHYGLACPENVCDFTGK